MSQSEGGSSAPGASHGSSEDPADHPRCPQIIKDMPKEIRMGFKRESFEESSKRTGLPVSFFDGTWRDAPEYMAKYVTPHADPSPGN